MTLASMAPLIVYTRPALLQTPISSTNHPRSLPVHNGPSAGSKLVNIKNFWVLSLLLRTFVRNLENLGVP